MSPDIVLTVKADDQVSKVLDDIKRKASQGVTVKATASGGMKEASAAGGMGKMWGSIDKLSDIAGMMPRGMGPEIQGIGKALAKFGNTAGIGGGSGASSLAAGGAGGAAAGAAMAIGSFMKEQLDKLVDLATKVWEAIVASSGWLQSVLKLIRMGFDNILRPIGDTIAMLLMPAVTQFAIDSAHSYGEFAAALKGAAPGEIPGILATAMKEQLVILGNFTKEMIPTITTILEDVGPPLVTALLDVFTIMMPTITAAITQWTPALLDAIAKGFANWMKGITGGSSSIEGANYPSTITHAAGGIFTRPTLGIIGEAGPEAVIPLSRGGGIGGGVVFNITVGNIYGVEDLRREMTGIIDGYAMRSNFRR